MNRLVRRPSPALVVACIALAVALSGASYAAVKLPRNSVGTPQLKRDAVVSSKVKNRSLKALDFAAGQLPAGPRGPQGLQGPPGPTVAEVEGTSDPPAQTASGSTLKALIITTTAPGDLLVGGDLTPNVDPFAARLTCTAAGSCLVFFGIYVDGVPVPGAARALAASASQTRELPVIILRGVLANVAAGAHSVELRQESSGSVSSVVTAGSNARQLQAIAVG